MKLGPQMETRRALRTWRHPSPGDLPNSGIEPRSPALQADSLLAQPPGKPKMETRALRTGWLFNRLHVHNSLSLEAFRVFSSHLMFVGFVLALLVWICCRSPIYEFFPCDPVFLPPSLPRTLLLSFPPSLPSLSLCLCDSCCNLSSGLFIVVKPRATHPAYRSCFSPSEMDLLSQMF